MALLNDITLQALLSNLVAFLVVTAVHGFALAAIARLLGDMTPTYAGRFTINPLPHLSMPGLAMAALFRLGWIVPMKLTIERLRWGRLGIVVCVVGSLLATLLLVPLLWPLRGLVVVSLPRTSALAVLGVLDAIQGMAAWFVAFNVIPLPPLTGSLLLVAIWPNLAKPFARSAGLIQALMVLAIVTGLATVVVGPIANALQTGLAGLR